MNLTGQTVLVTGAGRRVGRVIALTLADAGCDVAVHAHRSATEAQAVVDEIRAKGRRSERFVADLADAPSASELPARVHGHFGRLDILVNNASVFTRVPLNELSVTEWQRTFAVNVIAVGLLCQAAAGFLRESKPGRIVNITDIGAHRPWPNYIAYCASKGALQNLTLGVARALAPDVLVNAVAPGLAEFPDDMPEATRRHLIGEVPARRSGTPAEVAAAVRFLVQDASYVTGSTIVVDGGREIAW